MEDGHPMGRRRAAASADTRDAAGVSEWVVWGAAPLQSIPINNHCFMMGERGGGHARGVRSRGGGGWQGWCCRGGTPNHPSPPHPHPKQINNLVRGSFAPTA